LSGKIRAKIFAFRGYVCIELAMYGIADTDNLNLWWIQAGKQKKGFYGLLYTK